MQREFSIFFLTASIRDFPPSITVTSQGEAGQRLAVLMGRYELDTSRAAMLRPVYRKTDGDYYIYYTSKREYVCWSTLLFVAVYTSWMIGPNITDYAGWIKSQEVGLQTIPTSGWSFVDERSQYVHDDKLFFIYN